MKEILIGMTRPDGSPLFVARGSELHRKNIEEQRLLEIIGITQILANTDGTLEVVINQLEQEGRIELHNGN